MARFLVKASEFKNVCKAVNDRKLAELKKEIIEILKKQDENEVKKAIDYFNSQELHYTHLEKSLVSGKWIEKAGYGIGTVRIWKGKKYKKIAPGKWARVFEKEGRGTNIAIGKLIAKVNKIDNVEDLMAFVMANKQRFVDENGVDLPVLDKLRAAVDARNNGGMGSNGTSKTVETKEIDSERLLKELIKNPSSKDIKKFLDEFESKEDAIEYVKNKRSKNKTWENDFNDLIFKIENIDSDEGIAKPAEKKTVDYSKMSEDELKELTSKLHDKLREKDYDEVDEEMEQINAISKQQAINFYKTREKHTLQHVEDVEQKKKMIADSKAVTEKELARKEKQKAKETNIAKKNKLVDEVKELKHKISAFEQIAKELDEEKSADTTVSSSDEKKYKQTKKMLEDKIAEFDKQLKMFDNNPNANTQRLSKDVEKQKKTYVKMLENLESEYEKTQNRSEAMKGNQNAKKYGLTDEQIERYDIQKVVEDVNGYGIVKNSEGKYSYIDDGRVKDRPDDFETSIEKVKERINDTYETKKNIQAAKDYDFKNAKIGSDIEYTKRSDGKHLYFKKSPDGSKAISVTVEVSDMREPLNMTYKVSDTKSGESWQYETAYGNKDGLEWAVEKPEQMEKELKKFFKRDPNKEWNKQNGDYKPQDDVYAPSESTNLETKKAIAENKSIGENEVQLPYSKELAAEMETLKDCVSRDSVREFMQRVYYDNGNLVATDGRRLKAVKVGKLDGIENGTYVDIDISKDGINIKKNEFQGQFPKYEKVIPDDLSQKVILNNDVIKQKLKEMRKDGAINKKGTNLVQFEFKDGKVYLDDTEIGVADKVNLSIDTGTWTEPNVEKTEYISFNADYLENALNGKSSTMMMGDRADKAIGISTDSTTNILMPMNGSNKKIDYSVGRSEKTAAKEKKAAESKRNKEFNQELCKVFESKYGYDLVENMATHIDERLPSFSDDDLQREYTRLGLNFDKLMEKNASTVNSVVDKKTGTNLKTVYLYQKVMNTHPEVKDKIIAEMEKRGISVKKSLFDDFVIDNFIEEDIDDIEKDREEESLWNDYSAEQPELFNSVELQVCEAMNRHYCNCL